MTPSSKGSFHTFLIFLASPSPVAYSSVLQMETGRSSITLVLINKIIRRHFSDHLNLHFSETFSANIGHDNIHDSSAQTFGLPSTTSWTKRNENCQKLKSDPNKEEQETFACHLLNNRSRYRVRLSARQILVTTLSDVPVMKPTKIDSRPSQVW
jgi:hypothetical protein